MKLSIPRKRLAVVFITGVIFGMIGFLFLSWRSTIPEIVRPNPEGFSADLVSKGESLAAAGHCMSCHTSPQGPPYAGGYAVNTPFGMIYGTNITPDEQTGIGHWSLDAFSRAMRAGISRDGSHLFAAFPYNAFTEMQDDDIKALYAFLMTRPPVHAIVPRNTVPFPLNVRLLQEGWKILFFKNERYQTNPSKSAEWNRGAYLAEAVSDCSGCHTPRNALGGEKLRDAYSGAVVDNWIAPALTKGNPSPIPWTEGELFSFLRTGATPLHGATASTMTPVIRDALALPVVPDSDVRAIAVYFSDMNHWNGSPAEIQSQVNKAIETSGLSTSQEHHPGTELYASACLSCHYNNGNVPNPARPELALSSAVTMAEPTNFIQAVLKGISATGGAPGLVMPSYASSFSDADVARLAAYLRRTRTQLPPWTDLEKKVAAIRKTAVAAH